MELNYQGVSSDPKLDEIKGFIEELEAESLEWRIEEKEANRRQNTSKDALIVETPEAQAEFYQQSAKLWSGEAPEEGLNYTAASFADCVWDIVDKMDEEYTRLDDLYDLDNSLERPEPEREGPYGEKTAA